MKITTEMLRRKLTKEESYNNLIRNRVKHDIDYSDCSWEEFYELVYEYGTYTTYDDSYEEQLQDIVQSHGLTIGELYQVKL